MAKPIELTEVRAWIGEVSKDRFISGYIGPTRHVITYPSKPSDRSELHRVVDGRFLRVPSKGKALDRYLAIVEAFAALGSFDQVHAASIRRELSLRAADADSAQAVNYLTEQSTAPLNTALANCHDPR